MWPLFRICNKIVHNSLFTYNTKSSHLLLPKTSKSVLHWTYSSLLKTQNDIRSAISGRISTLHVAAGGKEKGEGKESTCVVLVEVSDSPARERRSTNRRRLSSPLLSLSTHFAVNLIVQQEESRSMRTSSCG